MSPSDNPGISFVPNLGPNADLVDGVAFRHATESCQWVTFTPFEVGGVLSAWGS